MSETLTGLMDRVAAFPVESGEWNMEHHDWEKGCYVNGLLAAERRLEDARRLVDRAIETQTSAGCLDYGSLGATPLGWDPEWAVGAEDVLPADPTVMGHGVLAFYGRTGDDTYLDAARRHYEYLRDRQRTADGGIPLSIGGDELLIDTLYHNCRFFALYGHHAGSREAFDEAARQFEAHTKRLFDPHTGLYRQGWQATPNSFTQSAFWGRGVGWLVTSLADNLAYFPEDHPDREDLEETFRDASRALLEYQDASGYWHNVVDDPDAPLETSVTLMCAYAFARGRELGLLSDPAFEQAAQDAMDVCTGVVDREGRVRRVSSVPGGPGSPLKPQLLGSGWFLLAASHFE